MNDIWKNRIISFILGVTITSAIFLTIYLYNAGEYKRTITALQSDLNTARLELDSATAANLELIAIRTRLETDLTGAMESNKRAETRISTLERQLQGAKQEITAARRTLEELEVRSREQQDRIRKLESAITGFTGDIERLTAEVDYYRREVSYINTAITGYLDTIRKLEEQLTNSIERTRTLEDRLQQISTEAAGIDSAVNDIKSITGRITSTSISIEERFTVILEFLEQGIQGLERLEESQRRITELSK